MARPTKFEPKYHIPWAKSLAMEGLTDKEIAGRMEIAESTVHKWKRDFPEFSEALKEGKDVADAKVTNSLYRTAVGFTLKEKKVIVTMENDGTQKPARIETTEREVGPNVTSIIYWLKNRRPAVWKDRQSVESTISIEGLPATPTEYVNSLDEQFAFDSQEK